MNKFNKIVTGINTVNNLNEVKQQVATVENSKLSEEEKNKALKSHDKMIKTTVVVTISVILLVAIICGVICNVIDGDLKIILCLIVTGLEIIGLMLFGIFGRKLFSDWNKAYEKASLGFDGLSEQYIDFLKPNNKELLLIKQYKKKSLLWGLIFLIALGIVITIIVNLEIKIHSPIVIISLFIITGVWYVFEDTCQVKIHRIKSGYYKKSFGFICQNCKNEVKIKFEEIDKYSSLPKNKDGIRVMPCPKCNNLVPFYNFDMTMQDYKKYLEEIK